MSPIHSLLEEAARQAEELAREAVRAALVRVNLRNETYQVKRVIDGDTLSVSPPRGLEDWMKDVRVRLYGIDTPEQSEKLGPFYTELLERLCSINDGRVHIIWEREGTGTEYEGFPRTSFERGIGHVFIDVPSERVLYVNSFLAMFSDVNIKRGQKKLVRGAKVFHSIALASRYHWYCKEELPRAILDALGREIVTADAQMEDNPFPICLFLFPKSLVSASAEDLGRVCTILSSDFLERGCPYAYVGILEDTWSAAVRDKKASPFDIPILLANTRKVPALPAGFLACS